MCSPSLDIDVDSARKARNGIVENMLSLQDMDVSASQKESETFHAEMNIMFDEMLDATDDVESLWKEMFTVEERNPISQHYFLRHFV